MKGLDQRAFPLCLTLQYETLNSFNITMSVEENISIASLKHVSNRIFIISEIDQDDSQNLEDRVFLCISHLTEPSVNDTDTILATNEFQPKF